DAEDRFLVGFDLRKERTVLERAYDDPAGVTAQFNLNLLVRANRELGARFDPSLFRHVALYDDVAGRVEMHLESRVDQSVWIARLRKSFFFRAGERVHTEN